MGVGECLIVVAGVGEVMRRKSSGLGGGERWRRVIGKDEISKEEEAMAEVGIIMEFHVQEMEVMVDI